MNIKIKNFFTKNIYGKKVINIVLTVSILILFFQNCSRPSYVKISDKEAASTVITSSPNIPSTSKSNKLNITVSGKNTPIYIHYVIDDSRTMANSQKQLSDAVSILVNNTNKVSAKTFGISTSITAENFEHYFSIDKKTEFFDSDKEKLAIEKINLLKEIKYSIHSDKHSIPSSQLKEAILNYGSNGSDSEIGLAKLNSLLTENQKKSSF